MSAKSNTTKIRNTQKKLRNALAPHEVHHLSETICSHLAQSWLIRRSKNIACYLATQNEVSLDPLIAHAWQHQQNIYLPVLPTQHSKRLWFVPFSQNSQLYKNRFNIDEPLHAKKQRLPNLRKLDVILMPLLAYDPDGNRLGMGGGYYDRTLAGQNKHNSVWQRPIKIGIAYHQQCVKSLKAEKWDIPLDAVVTEQGLHWFRKTQ